jgi:hypothetical protein
MPKIAIGTRVSRDMAMAGVDGKYYRKTLLRDALVHTRKTLKKLKRDGYMDSWNGKQLPEYNKAKIRQMMRVIDTAYEVQVSGVSTFNVSINNMSNTQAYVGGGSGMSGMRINYTLLFRAVVVIEGKEQHVCVNTSDPMWLEAKLMKAIIPQQV